MQVWLQSCGRVASERVEEVRAALTSVSLDTFHPERWPPSGNGLVLFTAGDEDVCRTVRSAATEQNCVIALSMTARDEGTFSAWQMLEAGATDLLHWTGQSCAAEIAARLHKRQALQGFLQSPVVRENLIGRSPVWNSSLEQLVEAAAFSREAILLTGESGTGKELAARLVHALDQRPSKKELVVVDCTTLQPELAGSELFGHERGAYTGAVGPRAGAIELAHGGTLFLDEIGELTPQLQAQLLRSLQEKTFKRVGGNQWRSVEFRLISATNRDLRAMMETGTFRRDLYYRIASVPITLPPLRERPEDVIPLARHFLREMSGLGESDMSLDPALEAYLLSRPYPGNVRDLRQLVARMLHRHCGTRWMSPASLPEAERPCNGESNAIWPDDAFRSSVRRALAGGFGLQTIANEAKEAALNAALELEDGSVRRAAERLGVTERAVQMRRARWQAAQDDGEPRVESA